MKKERKPMSMAEHEQRLQKEYEYFKPKHIEMLKSIRLPVTRCWNFDHASTPGELWDEETTDMLAYDLLPRLTANTAFNIIDNAGNVTATYFSDHEDGDLWLRLIKPRLEFKRDQKINELTEKGINIDDLKAVEVSVRWRGYHDSRPNDSWVDPTITHHPERRQSIFALLHPLSVDQVLTLLADPDSYLVEAEHTSKYNEFPEWHGESYNEYFSADLIRRPTK